jgi:hypothetical protein
MLHGYVSLIPKVLCLIALRLSGQSNGASQR